VTPAELERASFLYRTLGKLSRKSDVVLGHFRQD
jgi:hypothetical protein